MKQELEQANQQNAMHLYYVSQLENNNTSLSHENSVLKQQVAQLEASLTSMQEQLQLLLQQRFGSSSEKVNPKQISLFDEADKGCVAEEEAAEPEYETVPSYQRQTNKSRNKEDNIDKLPVEEIDYRLTQEQCTCPVCNHELHEMSVQTRREIKIIPAQAVVVKHNQYLYSCRNCERQGISVPVIKADMPKPFLPKSLASSSAVAYIIDQKYTNAMPLYRQQKQLERLGFYLSRQTMSNWIMEGSERWLGPVYQRLHELLLLRDCIAADETGLQVLKEPNRDPKSKSYLWLYNSNGRDGPPIILFDYQMTRAGEHAKNFLDGFTGQYLTVDAYSGYNKVPDVILVYCAAHARRGFVDCIKSLPAKAKKDKSLPVFKAIQFFKKLYDIEKMIAGSSVQKRYEIRLQQSKPILDEFHLWLKAMQPHVPPKSLFGKAINYCLNQWEGLNNFLLDGRLDIDNNYSERIIKGYAVGRKNWLFCNTQRGADSSAVIYSIVETAKANNLKPMQYLTWLFNQLPNCDITDVNVLDSFLPWSSQIPQECKMPPLTD